MSSFDGGSSGGKTIYAVTQVPTAFCIGGQTLIGYPGERLVQLVRRCH